MSHTSTIHNPDQRSLRDRSPNLEYQDPTSKLLKKIQRYINRIPELEIDYFGRYRYNNRPNDEEILNTITNWLLNQHVSVPVKVLLQLATMRFCEKLFKHFLHSASPETVADFQSEIEEELKRSRCVEFTHMENLDWFAGVHGLVLPKPVRDTVFVPRGINTSDNFSHLAYTPVAGESTLVNFIEWCIQHHPASCLNLIYEYTRAGYILDFSAVYKMSTRRIDPDMLNKCSGLFWCTEERYSELAEQFAKKCSDSTGVCMDVSRMIIYSF